MNLDKKRNSGASSSGAKLVLGSPRQCRHRLLQHLRRPTTFAAFFASPQKVAQVAEPEEGLLESAPVFDLSQELSEERRHLPHLTIVKSEFVSERVFDLKTNRFCYENVPFCSFHFTVHFSISFLYQMSRTFNSNSSMHISITFPRLFQVILFFSRTAI
jgi:hypothetical protein